MSRSLLIGLLALLPLSAGATERLSVVSTIKPLQLLVSAIAGQTVDNTTLLDPGASPHHFQLKPSQRERLNRADLVLWIGPRLETPLASALAVLGESTTRLQMDGGDAEHHHGAEPHPWLDSLAMADFGIEVAEALARHQPEQAARYRSNAQQLRARLQAMSQALAVQLQPYRARRYLTSHAAWDTFAERYGLSGGEAFTQTPEHQPGARRAMEVDRLLAGGDVQCVLLETAHQPPALLRMVDKYGVKKVEFDPLALSGDTGPGALEEFYREMGERFLDCLGDA